MLTVQISIRSRVYNFSFTPTSDWKFRNDTEAKNWFTLYVKKIFEDHPDITPEQIKQINKNGVILQDGQKLAHPELVQTASPTWLSAAQKSHLTWKTIPIEATVPKSHKFSSTQQKINTPELPEITPGIGKVTFGYVNDFHTLNHIAARPRWQNMFFSKAAAIKAECAYLKMLKRASGRKVSRDTKKTRFGIEMSSDKRQTNYQEKITWEPSLADFFGQNEMTSTEIHALNSRLNGTKTLDGTIEQALTSSCNQLADTVSLMRVNLAENGSSDCYVGRVDTLDKAKEMAEFIFFGEIDAFENNSNLSKGISRNQDGTYELSFAVQSLLSMSEILGNDQKKLFYQEVEAYQQLIEKTKDHPLEIRHPKTGKVFRVRINPLLPIAANQFNLSTRIEGLGLGKTTAKKESSKADKILFLLAEKKIKTLKDLNKMNQIRQAMETLKDPSLQSWQIVMTRAYLCHLLDLPQVVHCMSSVDRTGGIAIPIIVAMKQWLRSKAPIPKRIYDIANTPLPSQSNIYPFRYLCYYKMLHELKNSQLSRGIKGLKINDANIPHPAAQHIFPSELFKKRLNIPLWNHRKGMVGSHHILYSGHDSE